MSKLTELKYVTQDKKLQVVCLTETIVRADSVGSFKGRLHNFMNRNDRRTYDEFIYYTRTASYGPAGLFQLP